VAAWRILTKNLDAVQKENVGTLDSQICMEATTQHPPALEVVANFLGYDNPSSLWDENVLKSTKGLQSKLTKPWGFKAWEDTFFNEDTTANLQYRMIDFGGPLGRAWMYRAPFRQLDKLTDDEVSIALRYRLDSELPSSLKGGGAHCQCSPHIQWTPEHALVCQLVDSAILRNARHTQIKYQLHNAARKAAGVNGISVDKEVGLVNPSNPTQTLALDLVFTGFGEYTYWGDVTVTTPPKDQRYTTTPALTRERVKEVMANNTPVPTDGDLRPDLQHALTQNSARLAAIKLLVRPGIEKREKKKKKHYDAAVRATQTLRPNFTPAKMIPLVFTSGGIASDQTRKMMKRIVDAGFDRQKQLAAENPAAVLASTSNIHEKATLSNYLFFDLSLSLVRNFHLQYTVHACN
jgi:hypothetical protein